MYRKYSMKNHKRGDFQWLRIHESLEGSMGSTPVQGTKIPHSVRGTPTTMPSTKTDHDRRGAQECVEFKFKK